MKKNQIGGSREEYLTELKNIETKEDLKKTLEFYQKHISQFTEKILIQSEESMGMNLLQIEMKTIINEYLQIIEGNPSLSLEHIIQKFHTDIESGISNIVAYGSIYPTPYRMNMEN